MHRLRALVGWRADMVSAGLGAVSALALPPIHALPILLIAVPGLLALIDASSGPRNAFRRGMWFGFGHHVLGLYWITEAILVEAADYWWFVPIAVPGLALILAPFIALPCAAARWVAPGWRRAAMLAGAWVLDDLARQFIGTGFPWNVWGNDWAIPGQVGDIFIQPAAWIGVHGLTLLTVLLAATPALGRRAMLSGLAALLIWAGAGLARLRQSAPPGPALSVVLVQGNVPQGDKWDLSRARAVFQRYLELTRQGIAQAGDQKATVAVWPESAFPGLLDQDAEARAQIAASGANATLVGSIRFPPGEKRPRNSLIAVLPDGEIGGIYDKWHLVPGGEYAPDWLPFAVQIVPGGGFARGSGPRSLHLRGLPSLGPIICYEAIFPSQIVDHSDRPHWIVNITNDAWFGNSTGPRQHLAAARMRAVEEGLPLVRAANTGISAVFDAHGHELARMGLNRAGILTVPLPGSLPAPLFTMLGLLIPGVLGILCCSFAFWPTPNRRHLHKSDKAGGS